MSPLSRSFRFVAIVSCRLCYEYVVCTRLWLKMGWILTLRKRIPVMIPVINRVDATRFGSAKGYLLKNSLLPKSSGNFLAGDARAPPRIGPKTLPIDQT